MLLSRAYLKHFFFQNLDDWSFDVFAVNEAADNHSLKFVGYELLQKYDLIAKYKISSNVLDVFWLNLEQGYSKYKNPYHNLLHGADVAQSVHVILTQSKLVVSRSHVILEKKYSSFQAIYKKFNDQVCQQKNVFISGNSLKIK
jgi:hypothetical protein